MPLDPPLERVFQRLFTGHFGHEAADVEPVAADASQRRMARLRGRDGTTAIAVHGPDAAENRAFWSYSRTFRALGLPVPELYAVDEAAGAWLEEDLGRLTLFDAIQRERAARPDAFPAALVPVYERVLGLLPRFQVEGGRAIDYAAAYPRPAFDAQAMRWDLSAFKYHFLMLGHVPFHEDRLEQDFQRLIAFLLDTDTGHFVYRDFQSRNVMLRGAEPWFIDYQGGRRGALQYDVASLLYDAKAGLTDDVRRHLLGCYLSALGDHVPVDGAAFRGHLGGYVLLRALQALGTYGFRGFYERKPRFLESVAPRVADLGRLLEQGVMPPGMPELASVLRRVAEDPRFLAEPRPAAGRLVVHVGSFSYRTSWPAARSGHGGGMVFDCRALPNPGREAAYQGLSGRDAAVGAYLEARPETGAFFEDVCRLVRPHLETARRRGFEAIEVHFGCTGGQHRSVYFAERLSGWLGEHYPDVQVRLRHAEAPRWSRPEAPGVPSGS